MAVRRFEQGDFGELSAMQWLASCGAKIAVPVGHNEHWDLVAELDGALIRVQVKTSAFWRNGRWEVTLCTRGGNRSWSGVVKRLDRSRFDHLFVHVGDGRRWLIPAAELEGSSSVLLGGPKYSQFEVESGAALPCSTDARAHAL
jgi:PD-(D/E)XK endonuclease